MRAVSEVGPAGHKTSVNACVGVGSVSMLYVTSRDVRCVGEQWSCQKSKVERDSRSDEGSRSTGRTGKAQARLRARRLKEAVLLPRSYGDGNGDRGVRGPRAVRATAIRLALDLASEVRGRHRLPAGVPMQWALTTNSW